MRFYKSKLLLLFSVLLVIACKQQKDEKSPDTVTASTSQTPDIKGEEVNYTVDTTRLKGYMAYNESKTGKRPGVLIIHEWWGHSDYVRERADMLAGLGYTAMALDMYGEGKQAHHPDDAGKFAKEVMSNIDMAQKRFDAALELLKEQPTVDPDKIAVIGYCFGGSVALTMANMGANIEVVAAFHSGVQLPVMPNKKLKAAVLVCNGADDPFIDQGSVTTFKSGLDSLNADYQYVAYPGVVHSFTSKYADSLGKKFNLPLAYNAEADRKSWQSLQNLLNRVFE